MPDVPSASEILSGVGETVKKAKTATDALIINQLDRGEQRDRDHSRPPTEVEQSWDAWMKVRKEGGDDTEARAAYEKISSPRRK